MPNRRIAFLAGTALAIAGAALAQDRPDSLLPPGFDEPPPTTTPTPTPTPRPTPTPAPVVRDEPDADENEETDADVSVAEADADSEETNEEEDLEPVAASLGRAGPTRFATEPFARASGDASQLFMRRMKSPMSSRWAHIGLRSALLASAAPPRGMDSRDWAAERIWLLLRMGEADAARLLLSDVPRRAYNARLSQMALQVALATSDLGAVCPVPSSLEDGEALAEPLVDAVCEALIGQPELATETIRRERRSGRVGGIDLTLAEKLIGAGSGTGRATTIEWDATQRLTAWRYGMATATGLSLPDNLLNEASPQLRAWHARASLLAPAERLQSARIAAGMGVFSGQAMVDLHSLVYSSTSADERGDLDAWDLRQAFVASGMDNRIAAMRRLWADAADNRINLMGARATTARAAAQIVPDPDLSEDAHDLIASMITGGFEREMSRWIPAVGRMSEDDADGAWGLLVLGVAETGTLSLSEDRIRDYIRRDDSPEKVRSRILVAGLAGLERISPELVGELEGDYRFGLGRKTKLTNAIDRASARRDAGSALLLTAAAMQTGRIERVPPHYIFHAITALRRTGQPFLARMIAAEALSRA